MQIETISRGAQFKGFVSLLGLIIFPFALIIGIAVMVVDSPFSGIIPLLISAAAFFLFLDVRGVQIDLEKKLVRNYRQYVIWKWGEWQPLGKFQSVQLARDTVYLRNFQPGRGMSGRGSASKISTFDVLLVSDTEDISLEGDFKKEKILLSEFEKHADAVAFMNKYATMLSLPSRDIYRELQQSAVSRRQGRR